MNRLSSIISAVVLILPLSVFAVTTYTATVNGITWTYTVSNGKASVGGSSSSSPAVATSTTGSIAIPGTLGGYPVTSIGIHAFRNCSGLTSITIPDSVTNIGESAFSGCSGLTSITIPDSVTRIGDGAFWGCSRLTSISIPDSVTSIGNSAFFGCSGLMSISVANDNPAFDSRNNCNAIVRTVDNTLLRGCMNTIIPDGVTSIGDSAFRGCYELTSIMIPDSVTNIGNYAFYECSGLTSISISDSVTNIGNYAFHECSGLTSITIPDSVTRIGDSAFSECSGLTSITIPDSVTSIGRSAFSGCSELASLTIGVNVRIICSSAFYDCFSLTSVTIPGSVTNIGHSAFYGCSDLTSVTIQNGVTTIGDEAFSGCSGLTSITIPDGVTSIGYEAFSGCSRLRSVSIPASVEKRGGVWFKGCQRIQSVVIPGWVSLESMFDYEENDNLQSITSAVVAQGSTSIAENAFYGCFELKSVTIPNTVTNIGRSAFEGCSKLTSVTIPDGVTSIGENAFLECRGVENVNISDLMAWLGISFGWGANPCQYGGRLILNGEEITDLVIPDGVTSIGCCAFYSCSGLTSVTIPNSVTNIGEAAFSGCDGLTEVHISDLAAWCGILFGWSANPCESAHRLFLNDEEITDLVIPDSVTSIADCVFSGCSNLTSITIPDGVTSIGYETFYDCSGLTSVTVPNGVTSIGWDAFEGCSGLKEVHISDLAAWCNISFESSFSNPCSYAHRLVLNGEEITDLVIPNNVTNFGRAFAGCSRLMSVTIPNSVSSIEREAFNGCSGLTSLMIPDSVTRIVNYAFYGCSGLATLYLPRTFKGKTSSMGIPSGCAVIFSDSLFLTVYSEFGQPSPSGTNIPCESNSVRHCSVSSPVASGSDNRVRHVCTGWTGTGSVPATGTGTNATFTIEEDSTLTWNWRKENQIAVSVSGVGSCAFGTQWVADGTTATAEIVPSTHLYAISLSGDTNGVTLAGTTLAIPSDGPRNIAVTVAEVKLSLDVATAHGTAAPSGRTEWSWGDSVSANVVADAPAAGVRHVCTGWTGTGSVPATGTGTNATFTIEEDSTLTWNWRKENQIAVSVSGVGSCAFGTQWVADGTTATAEIVPSTHLYAISLSGDTNGVTLAGTTLTIPSDGPRDIAVTVSEVKLSLDVATAHGTAAPAGRTEWSWGDLVSANVATDAPADGVCFVCIGWTGTGSAPATGTGTNATFTIEEDSTLTWNWRKENQIAVSVSGVGSCAFGTQWVVDGTTATAEIVPSTHIYAISLSGDTNGVTLAGTTLTIPSDGPRNIAVTVTEVKVSLAVETAHGTPTPAGTTEWSWGDSVSANVATDAPADGIRYVCTGWTGTGSVPATGTGTNVAFTIEEDSTLAWTWRKENQIAVSVSGVGSCAFGTQWIADGATVEAEIVPSTHLYAITLSGDTNGVALAGTTLTIPSDGPRDIAVTMAEVKLSFDVFSAHGDSVPEDGRTFWSWNETVNAWTALRAEEDGWRFYCIGWKGTGSVPSTGTGTNATFAIREDSSIEWQWETEVRIECSVTGEGAADPVDEWVWCATGTKQVPFSTAAEVFGWDVSGDSDGVEVDAPSKTIVVPADKPRNVSVRVISAETAVKTGGKPVAWRPGDDEPWRAAAGASGSSDGLCLKSGKIAASGTSSVETSVSGSGCLSFDWMISAGRGDTCSFIVDGTQVTSITRSTGWATVTAELGAGTHVLQWIYRRGTGSATGEDAAFLDNVDWRPDISLRVSSAFGTPDPETGTHALSYGDSVAAGVAEPAPADGVRRVCTGWSGTGSVPASGTASAVSFTVTNDSSLAWNWRTDYRLAVAVIGPATADFSEDWVESGTTKVVHWAPTVPYFATSLSGDVAGVVLDEAAGTLSVTANRARSVSLEVRELTLRNVLDEEMLDWTTDEERPWFPQIGTNADGEDAAQSGPAAGDDTSGLETVLQGAGTLSWTWMVSTDDNVGVDVLLDGEWLEDYAPGTDWSEESFDVAGSGPHVVRFEFWNAGSTVDAKGWLDRVSWTGDAPFGARLRLVSSAQTEAVFSTAVFAGGSTETMRRTLELATDETFATIAKTVELGYVTEKTVEEAPVSELAPETSYWARLRVARAGGEERVSETVPFRTAAHVAPALGTPVAAARAVCATVSVPLEALGSDGGAVEVTVAATVVKTGAPAGATAPATLDAPGTAQIKVSGLTRGTVYRFVATARSVATGLETSVSGGFTTDWGETPRIAAGGSGLGDLPAICFLPSESGDGEDFVIRIDNPVPGLWYPVYTNGSPAGPFAVQSCGTPESVEGGYIVRVPAIDSVLFVKIGVSEEYVAPGTAE